MEPREYRRMFSLEETHWWYRALRIRIARALGDAGALPSHPSTALPRCLDAGCGTGMLLAFLRGRVRATGLDASRDALALARTREVGPLVRASVEALPFRSASLDIILSADVLYHRGVRDDRAALREAARCLKPGGVLILNLPAFAWLTSSHDRAIHTARRYTAGEVRRKVKASGFIPLRVRYWNSLLFVPLALVRLLRRSRLRGTEVQSDLDRVPGWLNGTLSRALALEQALDFLPWPAGLSILASARRESDVQAASSGGEASPSEEANRAHARPAAAPSAEHAPQGGQR